MAADWSWIAVGVAALVAAAWFRQQAQPDVYAAFQHINKGVLSRFTFKPIHLRIIEAHRKIAEAEGRPFAVNWWAVDNLILPPKYLADLRQADGRQVNFFANISDAFRLHTSVGDLYQHDRMASVVRRGLSPQLPKLMPIVKEELDYAFSLELGSPADWKSFPAQDLIGTITHRAIGRILVGQELCRNDDFVRATQGFITSLFLTALAIVKLPLGPLRELAAWPLAHFHRRAITKCVRKLEPIVKQRIRDYQQKAAEEHSPDMITWTLDASESLDAERDAHRIALEIIHNVWAASSAPGGLVTEMIYRLILSPEYLEPLRTEAANAIEEHGWSERALRSLVLQDSYIREINRIYPTGTVICARKVMDKPFVLSDGLTLPPGTRIGFLSATRAPGEPEESTQFDGFRFARLAAENAPSIDEVSAKWAASTMAQDNLVWGYGNHCCPGRFFAVRVVKLVFTKLLLEYDVQFDGVVTERPPPWEIEGQFIPNVKQRIRLRKREKA